MRLSRWTISVSNSWTRQLAQQNSIKEKHTNLLWVHHMPNVEELNIFVVLKIAV